MKQYRITIDGCIYEVQIDDPSARPVTARLSGVAFSVDVETVRPTAQTGSARAGTSAGSVVPSMSATSEVEPEKGATLTGRQSLAAPIPGIVSSVVVKTGQTVKPGDELLTIEAMKMFNVIRSPWAGTASSVHVTLGKRVSQGEPLVTFTPI